MRSSVVDEIVDEIGARLKGLSMSEQEIVLARLHSLRAHEADLEMEFATKRSDENDDDENDHEIARLIGSGVGAAAGGVLGGRLRGIPKLVGRIAGAGTGSAIGGTVGASDAGADIGAGLVGAGLGVAGHRAVMAAGGYQKVGEKIVKGHMVDALRRAVLKTAARVV